MRILAIDVGSSSVKAALFDGRQFATPVRVPVPTSLAGERVEIAAGRLLAAFFAAARKAGAGHRQAAPEAIAFCTFSPGVLVMDHAGAARTAIVTHADRRSTAVAEELVRRHGKAFWLNHAGNLPYPGSIGASTLAHFRKHAAGVFAKGYRVGQASTFIGHALTGRFAIDPSQAVFLGLLDIRQGTWSETLCRAAGVDADALPEVCPADSIMGRLSRTAARRLNLPAGIPVVGGFVDTSAAILQTPMHAGQLTHSAGSTDVLAMCLERPRPAEGILTRPVGTGANAGRNFPERWLAVRTIASSGSAIAWARGAWFREFNDAAWRKLADKTCAAAARGKLTNLPDCAPLFAGERAAVHQPAGGSFARLHLSTTREQMLGALIVALTRQSAGNYRLLREIHAPAKNVYAMGGASALGSAMHAAWPVAKRRHRFRALANDNLAGLVHLAEKTLASA